MRWAYGKKKLCCWHYCSPGGYASSISDYDFFYSNSIVPEKGYWVNKYIVQQIPLISLKYMEVDKVYIFGNEIIDVPIVRDSTEYLRPGVEVYFVGSKVG